MTAQARQRAEVTVAPDATISKPRVTPAVESDGGMIVLAAATDAPPPAHGSHGVMVRRPRVDPLAGTGGTGSRATGAPAAEPRRAEVDPFAGSGGTIRRPAPRAAEAPKPRVDPLAGSEGTIAPSSQERAAAVPSPIAPSAPAPQSAEVLRHQAVIQGLEARLKDTEEKAGSALKERDLQIKMVGEQLKAAEVRYENAEQGVVGENDGSIGGIESVKELAGGVAMRAGAMKNAAFKFAGDHPVVASIIGGAAAAGTVALATGAVVISSPVAAGALIVAGTAGVLYGGYKIAMAGGGLIKNAGRWLSADTDQEAREALRGAGSDGLDLGVGVVTTYGGYSLLKAGRAAWAALGGSGGAGAGGAGGGPAVNPAPPPGGAPPPASTPPGGAPPSGGTPPPPGGTPAPGGSSPTSFSFAKPSTWFSSFRGPSGPSAAELAAQAAEQERLAAQATAQAAAARDAANQAAQAAANSGWRGWLPRNWRSGP